MSKTRGKKVITGFEPPLRSSHGVPVGREDVGAREHPHGYEFLSQWGNVGMGDVGACGITGVA